MTKRMLIDAAHAEETRVVVADEKRLIDYDHESSTKKQIKSNFYLAKVTRVEPSLQAAFVDFGGNRHGFLSFSEIHPDYYKIPVEDREALLEESKPEPEGDDGDEVESQAEGETFEELGGDESDDIERAGEAQRRRVRSATRQYKIQEVIKRRQILLVQVVKEERGNKGAALTTYLSLAGRYCVLMPNTARGGGISRKITAPQHRKRLRTILQDLEVPTGMGVILRTAGVERSKAEIKRDYEYLRRQWDEIRDRTLESTAPALIHEEGNVIKRALRDLYAREIEEILIDGDEAYKTARNFMKMMVPSHVKRIQKYTDTQIPMFHRYGIEAQLDSIYELNVHLPSGGYIVLNSTEALVAIDVNSGRATRQRNIEQTALHTNLEAAEEVARQLRLRDLAGLVVIDFIDMEEQRNNNAVERRLKESMRVDRARIQVGRISHFGLMELSRQRLRPSLLEASSRTCDICGGAGVVRSTESTSLKVLRAIEEEGIQKRTQEIKVSLPTSVALYVLNEKRKSLSDIELRHDLSVSITADNTLITPDFRIERVGGQNTGEADSKETRERSGGRRNNERRGPARPDRITGEGEQANNENGEDRGRRRRRPRRRRDEEARNPETTEIAVSTTSPTDETARATEQVADGQNEPSNADTTRNADGRRRRRRGRGGRRGQSAASPDTGRTETSEITQPEIQEGVTQVAAAEVTPEDKREDASSDAPARPPRSRSRRGTRSRSNGSTASPTEENASTIDAVQATEVQSAADDTEAKAAETAPSPAKARRRTSTGRGRGRRPAAAKAEQETEDAAPGEVSAPVNDNSGSETSAKPKASESKPEAPIAESDAPVGGGAVPATKRSSRKGWWNRVTG